MLRINDPDVKSAGNPIDTEPGNPWTKVVADTDCTTVRVLPRDCLTQVIVVAVGPLLDHSIVRWAASENAPDRSLKSKTTSASRCASLRL